MIWPPLEDSAFLDEALIGLDGLAVLDDSGSFGIGVSPPPPPSPSRAGRRDKQFLRRDPKADRRSGRNWEILESVVNSLMLQGYVYEFPRGTWNLQAASIIGGSGLTGTFTDSF